MTEAATASQTISRRALQRRETRERVYDAALAEIARLGLAAADIGAIAAAAGVARGTFYFHFETKEHVLVELERREQLRIVAGLERSAAPAGDLQALLAAVVRQVRAAERRLGPRLFRDMLSTHFGAVSSDDAGLDRHPLATFIVGAVRQAQRAGRVRTKIDATDVAVLFLTGLFALLATHDGPNRARDARLDIYVATILEGVVRA
jgi:AcrR family transcriptional regulator